MLEFRPEPIEVLKARFKNAISKKYEAEKVLKNPKDRPGLKRENVFDTEDGIRIIISRDIVNNLEMLHFSASILESIYKGPFVPSLITKIIKNFREISNYRGNVAFAGMSQKGIPHFYIQIANLN